MAVLLEGYSVILEPLDWLRHRSGLFAAVAGPQNDAIWTYMPIGPFRDEEHFEAQFEAVRKRLGWEALVIRGAGSHEILGTASYMRIRETHGSAEIGCVAFGKKLKRTREATEAIYLMARHLFEGLGYRRYEWKCHNENAASQRAATRFGFMFEGVFRNDMVVKGESRDTAWFAMTDTDWPRLKSGFEAWLSDTNFATNGRQIKMLEAFRV
jgi:RimJ/RimL family protein N-acetyltransferase